MRDTDIMVSVLTSANNIGKQPPNSTTVLRDYELFNKESGCLSCIVHMKQETEVLNTKIGETSLPNPKALINDTHIRKSLVVIFCIVIISVICFFIIKYRKPKRVCNAIWIMLCTAVMIVFIIVLL